MPRRPNTPCTSAPNANKPNPSRKLNPTRCSREGTLGLLDIPGLFMHSYSFTCAVSSSGGLLDSKGVQNDSKILGPGRVFLLDFHCMCPKRAGFGHHERRRLTF